MVGIYRFVQLKIDVPKMFKNKIIFLIGVLVLDKLCATPQLRIIVTAALADEHFEFRKQQYIKAFEELIKYGHIKFYVIEALKKSGPTFLDEYCDKVFYSKVNDSSLRDRGLNEAITVLDAFRHFNFHSEDIIIKLTGRYCLLSDNFFKLIENKCKKYDAFVKMTGDYLHTQCFAMRYKYFKEMLESFDYKKLDQEHIIIEVAIGNYIKKKARRRRIRAYFVNKLGVGVDIFGSTTNPSNPHVFIQH